MARLPERRLEQAAIKATIITQNDPTTAIPFGNPARTEFIRNMLISALQRFPLDVQEEIHLQVMTFTGNRYNPPDDTFPVDNVDRHVMLKNRIARSLLTKQPQDVSEIFQAAAGMAGGNQNDKR